jgi:hypothetical protein
MAKAGAPKRGSVLLKVFPYNVAKQKQEVLMVKFVRFTETSHSPISPPNQSAYINPEHVRIVRKDFDGGGGSIIGLVGYDVSVQEDLAKVIEMLSSAPRT